MGIETIIAIVGLAATIGSTVYSAATAGGEEERQTVAPGQADQAAQAAAKAEAERMRKKRGFMSTFGEAGMKGIPGEKKEGTLGA